MYCLLSCVLGFVLFFSLSSVSQPEAFVPVHFYGQIVQHEEGCAMLDKMVRFFHFTSLF